MRPLFESFRLGCNFCAGLLDRGGLWFYLVFPHTAGCLFLCLLIRDLVFSPFRNFISIFWNERKDYLFFRHLPIPVRFPLFFSAISGGSPVTLLHSRSQISFRAPCFLLWPIIKDSYSCPHVLMVWSTLDLVLLNWASSTIFTPTCKEGSSSGAGLCSLKILVGLLLFIFSIHWASLNFIFCLRWPLRDILKSKQEDDISWRTPRLGREMTKNAKSPDFYGRYLVRNTSWPRFREFKNFITTMLGTRYLANSGKIEGNWSFCWHWFTKMA